MTVMDLNDLVKAFEEKFGVSAACLAVAARRRWCRCRCRRKTEFTVVLALPPATRRSKSSRSSVPLPAWASKGSQGPRRRCSEARQGSIPKADAEALKKQLEDAGAKVELK